VNTRRGLIVVLSIVGLIGIFAVIAPTSSAEFESHNTEATGAGEVFETHIEYGSTGITCKAQEEGESSLTWTVEKEGKKESKASSVLVNLEKFGTCTYLTSKGEEGTATLSACEMELKESGSEEDIPVKIIKTCTIKIASCEIKIGSQEPKDLELSDVGASGEDTNLVADLTNITAEATTATCGGLCVNSTKAAKWEFAGLLSNVSSAAPKKLFKRKNGNVAAGETNSATHEFEFEKEKVICSETKFMYGAITMDLATIKFTPVFMKAGTPCKARLIKTGAEGSDTVTVTGCEFEVLAGRSSGPNNPFTFIGTFKITGSACEIKFSGSSANNANCERKVASQNGLAINEVNLNTGEVEFVVPKTKFTWTTKKGTECGEAETEGAHNAKGSYKGTAIVPGIEVTTG
jgi:hypothetical protein